MNNPSAAASSPLGWAAALLKRASFAKARRLVDIVERKRRQGQGQSIEISEMLEPSPWFLPTGHSYDEFLSWRARHPKKVNWWRLAWFLGVSRRGRLLLMLLANSLVMLMQVSSAGTIKIVLDNIQAVVSSPTSDINSWIPLMGWGGLLGLFAALSPILSQYYIYLLLGHRQYIVNALNELIYQKALRMTLMVKQRQSVGELVNLMAADAESMGDFYWGLIEMVYIVELVTLVCLLGGQILGPSMIVGVGIMFATVPVTAIVANAQVRRGARLMELRDQRVGLMAQVIRGMRVVKFMVQEQFFIDKVRAIRTGEIRTRRRLISWQTGSFLIFSSLSFLGAVAAFAHFTAHNGELSGAKVFAVLALLNLLNHPLRHMSFYLSNLTQGKVGVKRIAEFLASEDRRSSEEPNGFAAEIRVSLKTACYGQAAPALSEIRGEISRGSSLAIIGSVGAGKSTFLKAIVGEVGYEGEVTGLGEKIAIATQEPFIINGTIESNIRMGMALDWERLKVAIEVSDLTKDLTEMPGGLATEIGEHGINLSGGQKQRLALARAAYRDADVVLLDDPLSAVDEDVEDHLVARLLFGHWSGKTRLVVTHRLHHLASFDQVLVLHHGRMLYWGPPRDLPESVRAIVLGDNDMQRRGCVASPRTADMRPFDPLVSSAGAKNFIEREDRVMGALGVQVYLDYIRQFLGSGQSIAKPLAGLFALLALAAGIAPIVQTRYFAHFVDEGHLIGLEQIEHFACLGVISVLTMAALNFFIDLRSLKASVQIHDLALKAVMHTNVAFFDMNPVGRILNRFAADVDAVEREIPSSLSGFLLSALSALAALGVIIVFVPLSLILALPALYLYFYWMQVYRSGARDLKRLLSIARSPRYAHFKETLEGLLTIRAHRSQEFFWASFQKGLRDYQMAFANTVMLNRWFSLRIGVIGGFLTLAAVISVAVFVWFGWLGTGASGMVLVYTLNLFGSLMWTVRAFSELETRMTSLERLATYGRLPSEMSLLAPPRSTVEKPSFVGEICFEKVSVAYQSELPRVLQALSFRIKPGETIGLIGRTGAGKSTVFQSLFRFVEIHDGRILIDSMDIRDIPLLDLRKNLAIIPQDPTLFVGPLRDNLDFNAQYDDRAIWDALDRVRIADKIRELPGALHYQVVEGGDNFSRGEKQLICFARALLLDAKIILMDEVTASVDIKTDRLIHDSIRSFAKDRTVIIIAHRLETLGHCDRIFELENGSLTRIHTPHPMQEVEVRP